MSSDLDVAPRTSSTDTDDDSDGFAHHVGKDGLVEAMIYGTVVTALCGFRFVHRRDPQKYPVCPVCAEIHAGLPSGDDAG